VGSCQCPVVSLGGLTAAFLLEDEIGGGIKMVTGGGKDGAVLARFRGADCR